MIILYPTETLYALGVNALNATALEKLYTLKGRDSKKVVSWLVRNVEDITRYAHLPEKAERIAERFLPGELTLVLKVRESVSNAVVAPDQTIGFRVSGDIMAEKIINAWMAEYNAPLTCTSANLSGAPTFSTPGEILQQFGEKARLIDEVHDDGPRKGLASTVVRVVDDEVTVLREGRISEREILEVLK